MSPDLPILEIAKELLELEEKATPAPWQTRFIARLFKTARDSQYLSFNTHESRDWDDSECISHSRNHIRAVCEALVEAHEALKFYGSLSLPSGKHPCDVDVRFQIEGPTIANEWLKKYAQSTSQGGGG